MVELRIASYNCCSIRKRVDPIKEILSNVDILVCQETILLHEDSHVLNQFDCNFQVIFQPSQPPAGEGDGRPVGGLAVFYRKINSLAVDMTIKHEHFLITSVSLGQTQFYLGNIYLPCDDRSPEAMSKYQTTLGELQSILDEIDNDRIILIGDFNTAHNAGRRFWPDLKQFIDSNELIMNDLTLPEDTFTYLNTAYDTTSWIDHIVSSRRMDIRNISVKYECALYDHFPICMTLNIEADNLNRETGRSEASVIKTIDWKKFEEDDAVSFYNRSIQEFMCEESLCFEFDCHQKTHFEQIDAFYELLISSIKISASFAEKSKNLKYKQIPGWNDICREKYQTARTSFLDWITDGRRREGPARDEMVRTRKVFRNSLKFCRYNEQHIKDQKLADTAFRRKPAIFWKEVQSRTGKFHSQVADTIDGIKEPQAIVNLFAERFKAVNGYRGEEDVHIFAQYENSDFIPFKVCQITTVDSNI